METSGPSRTTRRQVILSSAVGALLGSAWGTSFLDAETKSPHPALTIYRTPELFTMLIERASTRVLLLDGSDPDALDEAIQATMGFLRQRLDIVIASSPALRVLSAGFMQRWNVTTIYATPDSTRPLAEPLAGRAIAIGDLRISGDSNPFGTWRATGPSESRPWYLEVRYHGVRCLYGSSEVLVQAVGSTSESHTTMAITNEASPGALYGGAADVVAVPAESVEFASRPTSPAVATIVQLYRALPTAIRLEPDAIIAPNELLIG